MMMEATLLEYQLPRDVEIHSTSALKINKEYILVPAISIAFALKEIKFPSHLTSGILYDDPCNLNSIKFSTVSVNDDETFSVEMAILEATFVSSSVTNSVESILKNWTVNQDYATIKKMLPLFFIFKCANQDDISCDLQSLLRYLWDFSVPRENVCVGDEICIKSTPFGNRNFINSCSKGIVSNILGEEGCFLFSDCPAAPGSEGSPMFLIKRDKLFLIGIVLSPLTWWRGEWIGLTLGVNLRSVIRDLVSKPNRFDSVSGPSCSFEGTVYQSVVQIIQKNGWGSGILLNKEKGIIITNSHVVEGNLIRLCINGIYLDADIVYKTPDNQPYDIAILRCRVKTEFLKEIRICNRKPKSGDVVYTVGYSLFPPHIKAMPTLSKGIVSDSKDYMLKTTCSVHPGASGGAVLDKSGALIGIIVCNARLDENGTVYPRINMAIPILAVYPVIENYITTGDPSVLSVLNVHDPKINRKWQLFDSKL